MTKNMDMEGKLMGYDKKNVLMAIGAVVVILVVFYAGMRYEKMMMSGGAKNGHKSSSQGVDGTKNGAKKSKAAPVANPAAPAADSGTSDSAAPVPIPDAGTAK